MADVDVIDPSHSTAAAIAGFDHGLDRHMKIGRAETAGPIAKQLVEDLLKTDPDLRAAFEKKRADHQAARDAAREEHERKLRDGG